MHKGQKPVAVKDGEFADRYRFALLKESIPRTSCPVIYSELQPYLVIKEKKSLIKFIKLQLAAGKYVPYVFTQFGAHAAREMFTEMKPIPKKLKNPTDEELAKYSELYLTDFEEETEYAADTRSWLSLLCTPTKTGKQPCDKRSYDSGDKPSPNIKGSPFRSASKLF